MRKKAWIWAGVVSVIALLVGVAILQKGAKKTDVQVTTLQEYNIQESFMTAGTLTPADEEAIFLRPDQGELKKVWVKVGDKVKRGDKLLEYKNPALTTERDQADLQVKSAELKLKQLTSQKGASKGVQPTMPPSGENIDQQIQLAKLEVSQAKKQLDIAKTKIANLVVKSKESGVVAQVNEDSSSPTNTKPIVVIATVDKLKIKATISEYDALKVKEGQEATVKSDAIPDKTWKATVSQVGLLPDSNNTSGLPNEKTQAANYPVELYLNDQIPIKLGSQVVVNIISSSKKAMSIPQTAIQEDNSQTFVFVVENGKAIRKPVKLGAKDEKMAEVVSGISATDKVIAKLPSTITSGMDVNLK
ncbi:efflux RND transporter periplasmic adaptor subunit [Thermoactinomyces sp. DSM 45892]|uniref:efflux RND transporter periplasmic adaptor subunit n=1 Tax=Thermoactinomyces sp. DSM 45892 TaxID=1882753 RepID=UPI000895B976|nr:efflux RND transporter periplasmic adaptor subunit [Thermoactinomyces sp. DSM 45892]SDZ16983.1 HlyD family secretion protein [Thermoactinomyces sp. DSM 45892]